MQPYRNVVQDVYGNVQASVTITVRRESDAGIATIYSDNGVTTKDNPFTTSPDGSFEFYAANNRYTIQIDSNPTYAIVLYDRADDSAAAVWEASGDTPTFVDSTSFTVPGDNTATYQKGRALKLTDATTIYCVVDDATYSSPNTTVTIADANSVLSASLSAVTLSAIEVANAAIGGKNTNVAGATAYRLQTYQLNTIPNLVSDFKCPTNGTSDCSTPLQDALDYQGPVQVPPFTYRFGTKLVGRTGCALLGMGGGDETNPTAILAPYSAAAITMLESYNPTGNYLNNFALENIVFDGEDDALIGFNIGQAGTNFTMRNVTFRGFLTNAITIEGVQKTCRIENLFVEGCALGVKVVDATGIVRGVNWSFENNTTAIQISGTAALSVLLDSLRTLDTASGKHDTAILLSGADNIGLIINGYVFDASYSESECIKIVKGTASNRPRILLRGGYVNGNYTNIIYDDYDNPSAAVEIAPGDVQFQHGDILYNAQRNKFGEGYDLIAQGSNSGIYTINSSGSAVVVVQFPTDDSVLIQSPGTGDIILKNSFGDEIGRGKVGTSGSPGPLVAQKLGVGNSVAGTTPGSVAKFVEVFDPSGTSLGYLVLYASYS